MAISVREVGAGSGYGLKIAGRDDGAVVRTTQHCFDGAAAVTVQDPDWRSFKAGFPSVSPLQAIAPCRIFCTRQEAMREAASRTG